MDVASTAFGWTLPDPFRRKRYDSFNRLVKDITRLPFYELASIFQELRGDESSWLSIIAGAERGRSLRDKLAHQTEFPIDYTELNTNAEKRLAVVRVGDKTIPLKEFINSLCVGVVDGFIEIENHSLRHIEGLNSQFHREEST